MAAAQQGGGWWGLWSVWEQRREEFDWYADVVTSEGGLSCPVCGEPLRPGPGGPSELGATVAAYCRFAGDHKFRAPADVIRPQPGARMGRTG